MKEQAAMIRGWGRWPRGWIALACAACVAAAPLPAHAYTFALTSGGDGEYLTWIWTVQTSSQYLTCLTSTSNPCPTISSVAGDIPLQSYRNLNVLAGGTLDWSTQPGQLEVVAMPVVYAKAITNGYDVDAWASIDAQTNPLVFEIVPQAGDPFPPTPNLQIVPRLVGTINQYTNIGTSTMIDFRAYMRVSLNNVPVSFDTLTVSFGKADGPDSVYAPAFPKGAANTKFLSGVPVGAQIKV